MTKLWEGCGWYDNDTSDNRFQFIKKDKDESIYDTKVFSTLSLNLVAM